MSTEIGVKFTTLLNESKAAVLHRETIRVKDLDGEMWDCGCHTGGSSAILKFSAPRKHLRMFDSFEGLPAASGKDERPDDASEKGLFEVPLSEAHYILGTPHKGWIPGVFTGFEDSKISIASVDLDLYEGTKAALEFIGPRIVPDGSIVVDDYDCGWKGIKPAVDEFLAQNKQFKAFRLAPEQIVLRKIP